MFYLFTQLLVLLPFFIFSTIIVEGGTSFPTLPIVDLGYELHQASSFNRETGLYNFSNIRYAEPPVGELRFRAPVPPRKKSPSKIIIVDQGKIGRVCPQASPAWAAVGVDFLGSSYFAGKIFNASAFDSALANSLSSSKPPPPPQDPRVSEDCLFLNIIVPQKVFEQQAAPHNRQPLAPVLVWIHGGGYTLGEKNDGGLYNPAGLIKTSQSSSNSTGLVYVAINYRLGAFGWLAGPDLEADGTANAGLYDQQLALRWVQKYIKHFGGDANRVTVMGESAGGGSIMNQLTAFGGGRNGPLPFQQAIIQSAGFLDLPHTFKQQETLEKFLSLLKVDSIAEARKLPASSLIAANSYQISQSTTYGSYSYGIAIAANDNNDNGNSFVPASARKLLRQGLFDKNVKILVGHNALEGLYFTNPSIRNESAFINTLLRSLPAISTIQTEYIANVLYPPIFDGSYGYTDQFTRAAQVISDIEFNCNTDYLNRAYEGKTYAYRFSVPPALHGQDVPYTFYNGPPPDNSSYSSSSDKGEVSATSSALGVPNQAIAEALQKYIVTFTATGVPNSGSSSSGSSSGSSNSNSNNNNTVVFFPQWGAAKDILDLNNITGIKVVKDDTANGKCAWWQKALDY